MASAERPTARTSSIMASDTAWPGRVGPGRGRPARSRRQRLERGDPHEVDVGERPDRHVVADARRPGRRPAPSPASSPAPNASAERRRTGSSWIERDRGRPVATDRPVTGTTISTARRRASGARNVGRHWLPGAMCRTSYPPRSMYVIPPSEVALDRPSLRSLGSTRYGDAGEARRRPTSPSSMSRRIEPPSNAA